MAYHKALELDAEYGIAVHNLALTYAKMGMYQEAINLYQQSIELLPSRIEKATSWNNLGNTYRVLNDYANAALAYKAADGLDPENISMEAWAQAGLLNSMRI